MLGRDWPDYQVYTQQIRQAYQTYPDAIYKPGRKQVLQQFLSRDQLYFTPLGQQNWEAQARQNLKMELSSL